MKKITILLTLCYFLLMMLHNSMAQSLKEYLSIPVDQETTLPVLIRGNLTNGKMLLFVQGGPGETAIDFARSDYPNWKKNLETEVAIAYYDQRGLNQKVTTIDSTKITYLQYAKDLLAIAKALQKRYKTDIHLIGHSAGGAMIQYCLEELPEESHFIKSALLINTPITNDYSPERYQYYRPLYLKNLATEMLSKQLDTLKWQEAYEWITTIDSITTIEQVRKWNAYVDSAFTPTKRNIGLGMVFKVIFSKPYGPFRYLNRKDDEYVSDLLWKDAKHLNSFQKLATIRVPILLLTGRFDDIASPEEMRAAAKLIPTSQVVILPNCGHSSFLDQPDLFAQAVLQFIEE